MDKKILYLGAGVGVAFIALIIIWFVVGKKPQPTGSNANVITVWGLEDKKFFDPIIANFQNINHGLTVNYIQKNPNEYLSDTINAIAAGKGPDVWAIPNDHLPQYHDKLVPINGLNPNTKPGQKNPADIFKEAFPGVVGQEMVIGNQIYGAPLSMDFLTLYWNNTVLNQFMEKHYNDNTRELATLKEIVRRGPQNWDEIVFLVQYMTKKSGNKIENSVLVFGTGDNIKQPVDILTLLMLQNGAKMTSDDLSAAQFHTATNVFGGADYPGRRALEFYTSFANPQNENYTWNKDMPDSVRAFAENKTLMMIDYTNAAAAIKNINPNANFTTFNIPQIKETDNPINFASYLTYTVTKASKNPEAAWNFVLALTTNATNTGLYQSISKQTPAVNLTDNEAMKTLKNWYKPEPSKTNEAFKEMIRQVNDGANTQTAIEGAANKITTLLQKLKSGSE